ncbi:hypothetical protein ACFVW8_01655 [Streptomyces sp. NPDC058221]|uniref:hypothetical protein n=1 Tax=Streptomyces sp. NPDC058221 TaxID=3346388 RepID=UPI0036E96A39
MERIVDLDAAATEIERRRGVWAGAGLEVGAVTWRDEAATWPQPLETDRGRVRDPDSVGVRIVGAESAELEVTLFRGGWADVGFFSARTGWEGVIEAPASLGKPPVLVRTEAGGARRWVATSPHGGPLRGA